MDKQRKARILLVILILFYFSMGLVLVQRTSFADEASWILNSKELSFSEDFPHPPLAQYIYKTAYQVTHNLRYIPLMINFASLMIIYWYLRRNSENLALISAALLVTNFWFLFASTQIDMNGSILSLFFLLGAIALLEIENKGWKKAVSIGLILTAIIYTKYSEFILFSGIYLFWILSQKIKIKERLKYLFIPHSISLALFSIYPMTLFFMGRFDAFLSTIYHTGNPWSITLRPVLVLLTYGLIFFIFIFFSKWEKKDERLYLIWIFTILLFYFVVIQGKVLGYERYFMILIFPSIILGAKVIERESFFKKISDFQYVVYALILFFMINLRSVEYIPHDVLQYVKNALSLMFAFNIPMTGGSGPAFYMNFESLIFLFAMSGFLFAAYLFTKNKRLILILISISLAFNIFLICEQGFGLTHPSYSKVTEDIKEYYAKNEFEEPVFYSGWQGGLIADLEVREGYDIPQHSIEFIKEKLNEPGGTALIVDFPKINDGDDRIDLVKETCNQTRAFSDKGLVMAELYIC